MRVALYKALYFASNGFNTSGNLPQSEDGARLLQGLDVSGNIPLSGVESRFLIGLAFRFTPKTVLRVERKEERTSSNAPGHSDLSQWVVSLSTYF